MKKYICLLAGISILSLSIAHADTTLTIKKGGATTAKVCSVKGSKPALCTTAPISFAADADWKSVKDSYTVADSTAAGLASKSLSISVGSDGGVSFTKMHHKK
jgi:hypothetical protein